MQLNYSGARFEWIPYNQFNEIKETGKNNSMIVYSEIWRDGPLHYSDKYKECTRNSNKEVTLKCLNDSQNLIEFVLNEVKIFIDLIYKSF